jgi:RNA polymerase sigma-70 factor, ECF subfamily
MPGPEERADDRTLVGRATRGDREAFGALVQRHQDRVFNLAYQVVRNREDALDVAQEAFVKAFASLSNFKGEASFTTWMHHMMTGWPFPRTENTVRRRRTTPRPLWARARCSLCSAGASRRCRRRIGRC